MMNDKELEEIRILLRTYLSDLDCHDDESSPLLSYQQRFINTSNWGTPYFDTEDEMNVYKERVRKIFLNLESRLLDSEKEEWRKNRTIKKLYKSARPDKPKLTILNEQLILNLAQKVGVK